MTTYTFNSLEEAVDQAEKAIWSASRFIAEENENKSITKVANTTKRERYLTNTGSVLLVCSAFATVGLCGFVFGAGAVDFSYIESHRPILFLLLFIDFCLLLLGKLLLFLPDYLKGKN